MKIKNEIITISNGTKRYDIHNTILDIYLFKFICRQIQSSMSPGWWADLTYCLLKFDNIVEFDKDSWIPNSNFDLVVFQSNFTQNVNKSLIGIQYNYSFNSTANVNKYENNDAVTADLSDYYGRKITAIGFNTRKGAHEKVCAIVDVSNYNLYLQEKQIFTITRKDTITSDALFWSSSKNVLGPLHLAPTRRFAYFAYRRGKSRVMLWLVI